MKKGLQLIGIFILVGIIVWLQGSSLTYWFNNPSKSQMQVFLHIPKSFCGDIFTEAQR